MGKADKLNTTLRPHDVDAVRTHLLWTDLPRAREKAPGMGWTTAA